MLHCSVPHVRSRRPLFPLVLLLAGVARASQVPVPAITDAPALVARMEATYGKLRDISASFTQVAVSEALGRRVAEKGHMVLRRPGLMRWEYHAPESKLFVARGEATWFWVPADNQVIRTPRAALREAGVSALLLDGSPSFAETYHITAEPEDSLGLPAGQTLLRFRPREPRPFRYALVAVDTGDAIARRIVVVDDSGNRTEYIFDDLRANGGVSEDVFDWSPPAGAEVIER